MNARQTARLLIFDRGQRLLLLKVDDPSVTDPNRPNLKSPFWVTPGGRLEEGEDVLTAARRELMEETGLKDAKIGPIVWYGEQTLICNGEPSRLKETFVVVRVTETEIIDKYRTEDERRVLVESKWWTNDELRSTNETVFPSCVASKAAAVGAGLYPREVLTIEL